jgi:hypothetical protein
LLLLEQAELERDQAASAQHGNEHVPSPLPAASHCSLPLSPSGQEDAVTPSSQRNEVKVAVQRAEQAEVRLVSAVHDLQQTEQLLLHRESQLAASAADLARCQHEMQQQQHHISKLQSALDSAYNDQAPGAHASPAAASSAGSQACEAGSPQRPDRQIHTRDCSFLPALCDACTQATQTSEMDGEGGAAGSELAMLWQAVRAAQAEAAAERSARAEAATKVEGLRARLDATLETQLAAIADIANALGDAGLRGSQQTGSPASSRSGAPPEHADGSALAVAMRVRALVQHVSALELQLEVARAEARSAQDATDEVRTHTLQRRVCPPLRCTRYCTRQHVPV